MIHDDLTRTAGDSQRVEVATAQSPTNPYEQQAIIPAFYHGMHLVGMHYVQGSIFFPIIVVSKVRGYPAALVPRLFHRE